ncbi:MAG: ATP-binding protein [Cytophagales bacterium]|nr:ATP-binding protein [Cytophagales bacterium]
MPEDERRLYVNRKPILAESGLSKCHQENACKFSDEGKAHIKLSCQKNSLIVEVANNGPGINRKDLDNVFQPFFRADATSKIKGYSSTDYPLSQRIISIHKGQIGIESTPETGTRVKVTLKTEAGF